VKAGRVKGKDITEQSALSCVLSVRRTQESKMHKDKRQEEQAAKGDLDHRIIVAGPETRARESGETDPPPATTAVKNGGETPRSGK
jgi:hypothetical protein